MMAMTIEQFISQVCELTKARMGVSSNKLDAYIEHIVKSIVDEMTDVYGLAIDTESPKHLMLVVDWAVWRYESRDYPEETPRHIQFRLRSLVMQQVGRGSNG